MLLRSLHIASRQLFYLLVISIILSLLGLMAAVWVSDEVAKRKDEIASWASDKIGYPVNIGQAGLYWFDLVPKLEVRQVEILQKQGDKPIITAEQVYISLDILQTINQGEPVVADARINNAKLAVERDAQERFRLTGLGKVGPRQTATTATDVLRWFSWFDQIQLNDIQLDYKDSLTPGLSGSYYINSCQLDSIGQQWGAEADISLPDSVGGGIRFSAQVEVSNDFHFNSWQAKAETDGFELTSAFSDVTFNGLQLESGLSAGSLTASWNMLGQIDAELNLNLNDVELSSDKTGQVYEPVVVNRLQGHFGFASQSDQTWEFKARDLQVQIAGQSWPGTQLKVHQSGDGLISAEASYLRLSDVTAIAKLMENVPEVLTSTQPAGDVQALAVVYQPEAGIQSVQLQAQDIAFLPWQDYPGANDLSFKLDWRPDQGEVAFDSHQTTVYADAWLDEALYLESLTGDISWRQDGDSWHMVTDKLNLWNQDLNLSLNGRINHQNETTDTDMRLDLQDVVVNRWRHYVPERIIPSDFERWSRNAFREGVIESGYIEMQGNPAAFPFDDKPQQGSFDMQLQVKNTQLHYAEGWPDIEQVNGSVTGQGNNLLIKSQSGKIAGMDFTDVTTTISNLVRPKPVLRVDGALTGTSSAALAFLQNSPLQKRFGSVAEWLEVTGNSDITLDLTVPLTDVNNTQASGLVSFADSQLTTKAVPGLLIEQINGQLAYSNDGVDATGIKASAFNEPITIDVLPERGKTRVDVAGKAAISSVRELWPELIPDFVSGSSQYLTQLRISEPNEGEFDVAVDIASDLRGVSIDAPKPLGKSTSEVKPLNLLIHQGGAVDLELEDWLSVALMEKDGKLAGELALGGQTAKIVDDKLLVSGRLDTLDLDSWLDWQAQRETDNQSATEVDRLDIQLDELLLGGQRVTDLQVKGQQLSGQWQLDLNSSQIKGQLVVPEQVSNEKPLSLTLDHLRWAMSDDDKSDEPAVKRKLWPALRLDIAELEINDMPLGRLNLRANRSTDSWNIETASLKSPVLQASLTGSWRQNHSAEQSEFDIVASSDDLKALLAYYGYQEVIEARQVQINSQLNWQGDLAQFSLASMQGNMDLAVGRGSLIEVEPGAAGRIFGLLSIAALPRRLALDFSDLFGKGFDFSSITGHFQFANGIARTSNLIMQGDSALIEVNGPANLVDKTYDQIVKVTPEVSSTLPLAGAVAGGPVGLGVGTAILLFDKLAGTIFDREIVNLISYSYQLSGPWDNPKLNIVNPNTNEGNKAP